MLPDALTKLSESACVTPSPCTFTKVFNLCLLTVFSLLPVNCKPSSRVATSCFTPFSSRTRRVIPVPSTAGFASPLFIVRPFAPFAPLRSMEPSLPLIATAEPSLPLTPMEPSLPVGPSLPIARLSFNFKS